jgi:hypothetical protein
VISAPRTILFGIAIGVMGGLGQLWLLQFNAPQIAPLRGMLSMAVAVLIGVIAGLAGKTDALKIAALMGFIAGVLVSSVGISLLIRNPSMLGQHPFASVESTLSFMGSVMAGTVVSSWLISGIAVLVALPLSVSSSKG